MENININKFKKNFCIDNESLIIDVYSKKSDIFLFNNQVLFKTEKYSHPLFLNYNYCLFCYDKRKTKYFIKNLIETHNSDILLFDYMKNRKIKLKRENDKKGKIIRRFIHSHDRNDNKENFNNINSNINSDTDLYIEINKNDKINEYKSKENNNIISKKDNIKINDSSKYLESDELSSITLEENSKSKEKSLEANIKIDNEKENEQEDEIINEKMIKLKSHVINEDRLKFKFGKNNNQIKTKTSGENNILNKSSDYLIVDEIKKTNTTNNYFSVLKNFALDKVRKMKRPYSIRKLRKRTSVILSKNIKNDKCKICIGKIQEKFTLICGHYFCRECLYERIKSILNCISDFDKIRCPICNELIDNNSLKRLLNEEEFNFYEKIKMRIEGLRNKNLIPCPYPDCEGFANRLTENKTSIFICQNNHYFCEKCMEVVDKNLFLTKKKHLCKIKDAKTMNYFKLKKKQNIIKRCPNCNCWVQKEQNSCNNVQCSNIWCNYEFCWICKSPYDEYHYKNPFSMCFGLSSINSKTYFTKNKRTRLIRCMIIFLILIFILLPITIAFFSMFEIFTCVFAILIDKSGLRNVKLKSKFAHKFFYRIFLLFYFLISLAFIPLGYLSLGLIIIITPFIFLFKKFSNNNDFD